MEYKCKLCQQTKPASDFYISNHYICKRCLCHRNSEKVLKRNLEENPDLPNEIWKDVVGYGGLYKVSNFGRVRSFVYGGHRGRLLTFLAHRQGYVRVKLTSESGIYKNELVHRLVAEAFLPNSKNKETVNHKDGNKANNCVDNLEWATQSENNFHAFRTGLKKSLKRTWKLQPVGCECRACK